MGATTIGRALAIALSLIGMSSPTSAADPIKIAYNQILPPFSEIKEGKASGRMIEIVSAAAERAGYTVEFVAVPLEQMEPALKDGRAIATIPTAASPDRRERMDF